MNTRDPMTEALEEIKEGARGLLEGVVTLKIKKLLRDVLHLNGGGGMRLLGYIEHWAATGNEDAQEVATQLHELFGEDLEPVEDVPS